MSSQPVTTFWRVAGMSYLQYINKASSAIRGALKEPAKRKAVSQETFSYNTSVWEAGTPSPKVAVDSVQAAGKI